MSDPGNTYSRALASFAALMAVPREQALPHPSALGRAAGLPTSSTYRAAAALEASGLLGRDTGGHYRIGTVATRIGMAALGFGDLARLAAPVLIDLRQSAQFTACLAVVSVVPGGHALLVGPLSRGRGARYVTPSPGALPLTADPDREGLSTLRTRSDDGAQPSLELLFRPLVMRGDRICGVGLALPRPEINVTVTEALLDQAAHRLLTASERPHHA